MRETTRPSKARMTKVFFFLKRKDFYISCISDQISHTENPTGMGSAGEGKKACVNVVSTLRVWGWSGSSRLAYAYSHSIQHTPYLHTTCVLDVCRVVGVIAQRPSCVQERGAPRARQIGGARERVLPTFFLSSVIT